MFILTSQSEDTNSSSHGQLHFRIGVVADTGSTEDPVRVFEETIKAFGDVDILINNAIIDETPDEWIRDDSQVFDRTRQNIYTSG